MKIVDIKTHVLSTPLDEPFSFSMGWVTKRSTMIVELITDEGVTGWGESLCHGLQPPEIARTIVDVALKPLLLGQDPNDVDVLWERMYNLTRPFGQKGAVPGYTKAIFSGLTTAELSRVIVRVIERHPELSGVYHVASEPIDKHTLLGRLNDTLGRGLTIRKDDSVAIDRSLDGRRFAAAAGYAAPAWDDMISELAAGAPAYDTWRQHAR